MTELSIACRSRSDEWPEYSQGVCADGAAILEDGVMLTIDEIVSVLNNQVETARCQQLVLDQIAEALGLEPGNVEGIGAAIEGLKINRFDVLAGKYEGDADENIKYAHSFETLAEAISAAESNRGYHFCRIEYQRWTLTVEETPKALAAGEAQ